MNAAATNAEAPLKKAGEAAHRELLAAGVTCVACPGRTTTFYAVASVLVTTPERTSWEQVLADVRSLRPIDMQYR